MRSCKKKTLLPSCATQMTRMYLTCRLWHTLSKVHSGGVNIRHICKNTAAAVMVTQADMWPKQRKLAITARQSRRSTSPCTFMVAGFMLTSLISKTHFLLFFLCWFWVCLPVRLCGGFLCKQVESKIYTDLTRRRFVKTNSLAFSWVHAGIDSV